MYTSPLKKSRQAPELEVDGTTIEPQAAPNSPGPSNPADSIDASEPGDDGSEALGSNDNILQGSPSSYLNATVARLRRLRVENNQKEGGDCLPSPKKRKAVVAVSDGKDQSVSIGKTVSQVANQPMYHLSSLLKQFKSIELNKDLLEQGQTGSRVTGGSPAECLSFDRIGFENIVQHVSHLLEMHFLELDHESQNSQEGRLAVLLQQYAKKALDFFAMEEDESFEEEEEEEKEDRAEVTVSSPRQVDQEYDSDGSSIENDSRRVNSRDSAPATAPRGHPRPREMSHQSGGESQLSEQELRLKRPRMGSAAPLEQEDAGSTQQDKLALATSVTKPEPSSKGNTTDSQADAAAVDNASSEWGSALVCADLTLDDIASQLQWPWLSTVLKNEAIVLTREEEGMLEKRIEMLGEELTEFAKARGSPLGRGVKSLVAATALDDAFRKRFHVSDSGNEA